MGDPSSGGFPRIHEDEEGVAHFSAMPPAQSAPAPVSPAGGIDAGSVTDLTERSGSRVETVVAETSL